MSPVDQLVMRGSVAAAQNHLRRSHAPRGPALRRDDLAARINRLGGMVRVLSSADPARKAKVYGELGLKLVYHPGKHKVLVAGLCDQDFIGYRYVSEGRTEPFAYLVEQGELWLDPA